MNLASNIHKKFMDIAIEEAGKSKNEVPVGAVIVIDGKIISKAHNLKEQENDVTSHAEILAIRQASKELNNWRLENAILYVTLEPCPMCATAILYARFKKVYFGAYDSLYGAFGSAINIQDCIKSKVNIKGGIEEEKCSKIIKEFFSEKR